MIFIGYNPEGYPVSIVNAKTKELAYAYWQGANMLPHSHKCLEDDFSSLDDHPTGVFPILKTKEFTDYDLSHNCRNPQGRKYLMVEK